MHRPTLCRLGPTAVVVAMVIGGACSSNRDERVATPSDSTAVGPVVGPEYQVPTMHPSDWGAPEVALPDAPRPYGRSPAATADPGF